MVQRARQPPLTATGRAPTSGLAGGASPPCLVEVVEDGNADGQLEITAERAAVFAEAAIVMGELWGNSIRAVYILAWPPCSPFGWSSRSVAPGELGGNRPAPGAEHPRHNGVARAPPQCP